MKRLVRLFKKLAGASSQSRAERYLARSVDAHDLEYRVKALERHRG